MLSKLLADVGQERLNLRGNVQRAGIRLRIDVQQHRIGPVGGHDIQRRLRQTSHIRKIADRHGASISRWNRQAFDLLNPMHPAIDDRQVHALILLMHSRRRHQIVIRQRLHDGRQIELQRRQSQRIDDHDVFRRPPAHQIDARYAGYLK